MARTQEYERCLRYLLKAERSESKQRLKLHSKCAFSRVDDRRIGEIEAGMKASTWRHLETKRKFTKNDEITFINEYMLIIVCDMGCETHYARTISTMRLEPGDDKFQFDNIVEGFEKAKHWTLQIAAKHEKKQIVLGLEPTGHQLFPLVVWMILRGISVVWVNPYEIKHTKEVEDNSQLNDYRKDPKVIANLVKDGNYGIPYLQEGMYAELGRLSMLRDQLTEDGIRSINPLNR